MGTQKRRIRLRSTKERHICSRGTNKRQICEKYTFGLDLSSRSHTLSPAMGGPYSTVVGRGPKPPKIHKGGGGERGSSKLHFKGSPN